MLVLLFGVHASAQQLSAPMQTPFYRSERERKKVGDVGHRPLLEVAQLDHDLKLRRQFRQMFADLRLGASAQQRLFGAGGEGRAMAQNQRVEFAVFGRLLARFPATDPPGSMPGDGTDPGAETRGLLKLGQRLESQQERLLRESFRGFPGAQRLRRDDDDRAPITEDQLIERLDVAQQSVQDQLLVADIWVAAPLLCHSFHSSCKEETAAIEKDREP